MPNIIIDIGNTAAKAFLFEQGKILRQERYKNDSDFIADFVTQFTENLDDATRILVSCQSTHKLEKVCLTLSKYVSFVIGIETLELCQIYKKEQNVLCQYHKKLNIPILIKYTTPQTLGFDRIAGAVGATVICPNKNTMIIDAGTAITYDVVSAKSEFLGGNISPGMRIRFESLHNFTEKLPLLSSDSSCMATYGESTKEAIILGVQNGILYEIEGNIDAFSKDFSDLNVIFTGGDCFFFENKIKNCNFAEPNLVAIGLNEILENNAN